MPSYSVLSSGLYTIPRAEVLCRAYDGETPAGPVIQLGDVDAFGLSLTPTKLARFRKNARVRTKAAEIVNQIDSAVNFTCFQFSTFVRLMSILGRKVAYAQEAGSVTYTSKPYVGLHYVGSQDISAVVPTPLLDEVWTEGTHFRIVDAELGVFEIMSLPEGVTEEDDVGFDVTVNAITDGSRMKARVGAESEFVLEMWVRDVGANSIPQVLHLHKVAVAPSGEVPFIGGDDFSSVAFSGSALDTTEGLGYLIDLAA